MSTIKPFRIDISPAEIEALKARLTNARWPETEPVDDWSQGLPTQYHKDFCEYWTNQYDWFATQHRLNQFTQYITNLDGLDIHFIHIKSRHANAKPLLITHGWPGSVRRFSLCGTLTRIWTHSRKPSQPNSAYRVLEMAGRTSGRLWIPAGQLL